MMNKQFLVFPMIIAVLIGALSGCISQQHNKQLPTSTFETPRETPKIVRSEKNNIIDFSIKPRAVPEIKIGECAYCGKETENACERCKLTCYCSQECLKLNKWKHSAECDEIRQAYFGDLECMKKACYAYFRKAALSPNDSFFLKRGMSWFQRTLIRLSQDIECSKDPSTMAAIEQFCMEVGSFTQPLVKNNICTEEDLKNLGKEVFSESIEWVARITKANMLVPPYDIRIYGLKVFKNPELNIENEFIPKNEWYAKRMSVLQEYEKRLNDIVSS